MPVREIRNSSAIERVGYNDETHNLSIWFKGGRRYIYSDVPRAVFEDLCEAPSAGQAVSRLVKGKFPCRLHEPYPRARRPVPG